MKAFIKMHKKEIGLLLVAVVIVLGFNILSENYISTKISIQYDGIGEGLNPDGTIFDTNQLISEDVLKYVFEKAGVPFDGNEMDHFSVMPILPKGIVETIKEKRVDGENYTYYPNEFEVQIQPSLSGTVNYSNALKLARAYREGYETYFKAVYISPYRSMTQITESFKTTDYDYPELSTVLEIRYNILIHYLNVLSKGDEMFKSSEGITFNDLIASLNTAKNIDLNKVDAIVRANNLTKNEEKLVMKYEYMIKRYSLEQRKNNGEYAISNNLLQIAKNKENTTVLPGGVAGSPMVVKSYADAYDELAQKATEAIMSSSNKDKDIQYLRTEIYKVKSSKVSAEQKKIAVKQLETILKEIKDNLTKVMDLTQKVSNEYFEYKFSDAIRTVSGAHLVRHISTLQSGAMVLVLWVVFLILGDDQVRNKLVISKKSPE